MVLQLQQQLSTIVILDKTKLTTNFQGVLNAEGEAVEEAKKAAWKDANTKNVTMKDKTKKNVAFEAGLFTMVFGGFTCFNLYYWSTPRAVFQ